MSRADKDLASTARSIVWRLKCYSGDQHERGREVMAAFAPILSTDFLGEIHREHESLLSGLMEFEQALDAIDCESGASANFVAVEKPSSGLGGSSMSCRGISPGKKRGFWSRLRKSSLG